MAHLSILLKTEAMQADFHIALRHACAVASKMIEVRTTLKHNHPLKIVTTECDHALGVMRAFYSRPLS